MAGPAAPAMATPEWRGGGGNLLRGGGGGVFAPGGPRGPAHRGAPPQRGGPPGGGGGGCPGGAPGGGVGDLQRWPDGDRREGGAETGTADERGEIWPGIVGGFEERQAHGEQAIGPGITPRDAMPPECPRGRSAPAAAGAGSGARDH